MMPSSLTSVPANEPLLSLAELMAKVAGKDKAAFALLYEATALKLFGIVFRILKRRSLAEDIVQDVYIKIWERAGDYVAARGSPITWMASIAHNRAIDEARRHARLISTDEMPGFEEIPSDNLSALADMERSEDYRKLETCLGQLETQKRQMIVLAYTDGVSREGLAEKFDQPVSTVKTWLRRSLLSLKACLDR